MRKLAIVIGLMLLAALGLTACGNDKPAENWNPINLTVQGSAENIKCEEVDSALRQIDAAVTASKEDGNNTMADTIGLTTDGKIDQAKLDNVKQRTEARKASDACKAAASTTTTASNCVDGFVVKLDANAGGNLFSQGISPKSEDAKREILAKAKEDPRVLQVYYNASPRGQKTGVIQKTEDIAPLQNGACYTEQGRKWYASWAADWELVEVRNDRLPANGTNTGAVPNGQAFQSQGAIPAGTAFLVVYYDATGKEISRHWIRIECGNPVDETPFPGIGGPPPGAPPIVTPPPSNPPPSNPPPTNPPENPVCPPGTTGTPPLCKDEESAGPAHNPQFPDQQRPNPLPASPEMAQPNRPASPPPVYVPPARPTPVVPAPGNGGPTPYPTQAPPRNTPAPETQAPAPSAPQQPCIPSPGKTSC